MNYGSRTTMRHLLDEVDATRHGMAEERAIRILIEDRVERFLFTRAEGDEALRMLGAELLRRDEDSLADTFSLTEVLRQQLVEADRTGRCALHPAYEADYCPTCGTAAVIR